MEPTYRARVIVLRKTKLGEADLIVTLLAQDGSQLRAVAKGARKPSSPFSSRLELGAVADVLLAHGRSLDIVKEARLVAGNERIRESLERNACAAPMTELLDRLTQEGLENARLFPLTETALAALGRAEPAQAPAVCAAQLLKTFAFVGLRPSFDACVGCSAPVATGDAARTAWVSYADGGVVCPSCRVHTECVGVPAATVAWCRTLLMSTFAQVERLPPDPGAAFGALRFCQEWSRFHVGHQLKSLNFLFTCGLF